MGFITAVIFWQCFQVMRSTEAYHEDDFPHKIPEVRYSFLVTQYPVPQARNKRLKSSVAHWNFREIELSSFLTLFGRQKSLHKMHTNNECFHRLIHHCKQGLNSSVYLIPVNNSTSSEQKEGLTTLFFSVIEYFPFTSTITRYLPC